MSSATSQDYVGAVAIIGMSGRFPGARSVADLWQNIAGGICSIRHFSDEELLAAGVPAAALQLPDYVKAGTVIDEVDQFDAEFFGYPAREVEVMDPQHRLFLECAWEALEDAACNPESFRSPIGVFGGSASSTYLMNNIASHPEVRETMSEMQVAIGTDRDSLAATVSYKLNLRGPAVAVQTACSSSLVAVHLACQSLLTYDCSLAVAGGVAIGFPQGTGYQYQEGGILSPDGACRAFDARAQGSVMGNGVGVVVLKRMEDALADGDAIYAVILGSAINNDGSRRVGYAAPGLSGQSTVIATALSRAGVKPETVSYIETHGTGTPLGDSIELSAMTKAFQRGTSKKQFCAISSVKPNIGHLDRASGVTGLIKATMAIHNRQIPPSIHFERPNPEFDMANSPFFVNTQLRDWKAEGQARRAGVNSFGLGGNNVHVVLEEPPARPASGPSRPFVLLPLSAKSPAALDAIAANLAAHLRARPEQALADVAFTLQVGRSGFNHRRAMVVRDRAEALAALEGQRPDLARTRQQNYRDRPIVLALPEGGALTLADLGDLAQAEPAVREAVEQCSKLLTPLLGYPLRGPTPAARHAAHADAESFTAGYALGRLLTGWGVQANGLLGRGSGEYAAACLAGVLPLEQALALLVARVSGAAALARLAGALKLSPPSTPLLVQSTAMWLTEEQATDPEFWTRAGSAPERFEECLATLWQEPSRVLLALSGPKLGVAIGQARATKARPDAAVLVALPDQPTRTAQARLLDTLAELWLGGVQVAWAGLSAGERRLRLHLPTYPFERRRYWLEQRALGQAAAPVRSLDKQADPADWFYLPAWKRALAPQADESAPTQAQWLILADAGGLGAALGERLGAAGHSVTLVYAGDSFGQRGRGAYTLNPDRPEDFQRLLGALPGAPAAVVHGWSLDCQAGDPLDRARFDQARRVGFDSLLALVRALGRQPSADQLDLWLLTREVEGVTGAEELRAEHALLTGASLAVAQENLDTRCRRIDIDRAAPGSWQERRLVDRLAAELTARSGELAVAYRSGERWTLGYAPVRLEPRADGPRPRAQGVYLITGAFGPVGLALAEHLARGYQARLVLTTRSSFPAPERWGAWLAEHPQDDPTSAKIRVFQTCQSLGGQVLVVQADASDEAQLRAAVQAGAARFGALHGVIYAAGTSDPSGFQPVPEITRAGIDQHFAAKVYGLMALERALEGQQLDFCVLFSSLASVLGGLGFVAYSAANSFIDTFVQAHNQRSPQRWLAVNWDTWDLRENPHGDFGTTVMAFAMQRDEACRALERVIGYAQDTPRIVNSTGDLDARLDQWVRMQTVRAKPETTELHPRPNLLTPYAAPGSETEQIILEIWQSVLGVELGIHDNFLDLGGNSLIGTQVVTRLRRAFQTNVPLAILFESPTVAEMAEAIELILIEEIEQLDDEEVSRLVESEQ